MDEGKPNPTTLNALENLVQERTRELQGEVAERRRAEQQVRALLAEVQQELAERQRAEESLRQSQERYSLAERATQDGLWDWNILTNEEYFSPRCLEIIGLVRGEIPGHKAAFFDRLHPDDLQRVDQATREHLATGGRYEVEFRLRHKDGSYRWVFSRGDAVRDATGRPIRMVGAITDITDRKRMEAEMQRVNQWVLNTQRISHVGGWAFNLQTGEAWVSPEALRIYGASAGKPITVSYFQSFPLPQFRPLLDTALRELVAGRRAYDVEFQIRRGTNGAIADIHSVAEYHASENTVLGVLEEITERRRAEAALENERNLLRTLVDHLPDLIYVRDLANRFVVVNQAFAQHMGGTNPADFTGKTDTDFYPPGRDGPLRRQRPQNFRRRRPTRPGVRRRFSERRAAVDCEHQGAAEKRPGRSHRSRGRDP